MFIKHQRIKIYVVKILGRFRENIFWWFLKKGCYKQAKTLVKKTDKRI